MKWRDDPKPGWLVTMKYWWENFNRTPHFLDGKKPMVSGFGFPLKKQSM